MIGLERRPIEKYVENMGQKWNKNEHKPEVVMENDKCKMLWDFPVKTDQEIYGRRRDVIVVQKNKNLC